MISPKSGMHPTANQRGCHRELAAHHVALAAGDWLALALRLN
jgi:hypothetical protein